METTKRRILIGGFINTNVLDGSAIFISSLSQVVALNKDAQIDVLLAVPNLRDIVLSPLEYLENVNIIDPFQREDLNTLLTYQDRMNQSEYALLLNELDQKEQYDQIMIRSFEVVETVITDYPHLLEKMFAYITGITNSKHEITDKQHHILSSVTNKGGKLLCQTPEMKSFIIAHSDIKSEDIIYLNPMIPNSNIPFQKLFKKKSVYNTFCYTGKFANEWNINQMVTQFRELNEKYPETKLYVAGDQFKGSIVNPLFANNARYLLQNSKDVIWLGAIPREKALALIKQSDVGLTYRHKDLDDSLELSTKLLEYCSQAVPPILNKNEMHLRIFGEDYPYFANTDAELYDVMEKIITDPILHEQTAKKVYDIAKEYSFISTYKRIAPYIGGSEQDDDYQYLYLDDDTFNILKQLFKEKKVVDFKFENDVISYKTIDGASNTIEEIIDMLAQLIQVETVEEVVFEAIQTQPNSRANRNLKRENDRLRRDIKRFRQKYNNLSNSKLGAIQKKYWKFKAKKK
ncbi:glycosyltransferase family 1 protein [Macrococcoides canis]|uniref:glycosyltransferase n=1 Tax=Macrococcoides canis TaxID=1855823 RepID=UPI00105B32FE|nr:glycosyltransferase [Macrococcus canis]TDM32438.1 glycosyltransferase family 1 protein [Macrococcus canis]